MRRAGREKTSPFSTSRRKDLRSPSRVQMKPEDDPDVVPAVEILDGVLELRVREKLDRSLHPVRGVRLTGRARLFGVRRSYEADRSHDDFGESADELFAACSVRRHVVGD